MDRGGQGGTGGAMDHAVVSRMMLKFRPIAPKPVSGETTSGTGTSESSELSNLSSGKVKLPKRKYVRSRKNNIKRSSSAKRTGKLSRQDKEDGSPDDEKEKEEEEEEENVNTLRLLPEMAEEEPKVDDQSDLEKPLSQADSTTNGRVTTEQSSHFGLDLPEHQPYDESSNIISLNYQLLFHPPEQPVMMQDSRVLVSKVMAVVETVTVDFHTTTDPRELGVTDTEIIENLGLDTSPGFVSDSSSKICWVNGAFRRMVMAMGGQSWPPLPPVESAAVLVVKERLPDWCRAFSGWVRVKLQRAGRPHRGTVDEESSEKSYCNWQQVVPCDVWRMECGGFAWRLDLKAALTLGRLT
ncbi:hypothetical protein CDL15_Pgr022287 [Punica granatum]|uniref:DUF7950 domain-containing protein n=1 Tax=Punica granatum TaxID=22663 RepID=A0A218WMZ4_PUNGR|nr:hypothetical protein CDL15_Pgr022287 [Punica granatum]